MCAMKKLGCILFCAVWLVCCVSRGTADRIREQKDSLERVVHTKDSVMNEVFASVNAIAQNLSAIRIRENLITSVSNSDQAVTSPTGQIDEDMAAIDQLLRENRTRIEALEKSAAQLRRARVKVDGLEKMIAALNEELEAKNGEIVELKQSLAHLGIQVETLNDRVEEQAAEVETLSVEKQELSERVREFDDRLHTAYYIVGRQKELLATGIAEKKGFIGRTLKVKENPELDRFTRADTRTLREIPVGQKNVTLVTLHAEDSYELRTADDKTVEAIVITDPERFWSYSKMLVVSFK